MPSPKTIATMQPYFFPYLGYFQLIAAADTFVLYDDVQFISRGWVNRNRILVAGKAEFATIPLRQGGRDLPINQRELAENFPYERDKLLKKIAQAYARAPFHSEAFPLVADVLSCEERNLAAYLAYGIGRICAALGIATRIETSSSLAAGLGLRGQERMIAIVKALDGDVYVNPAGGVALYDAEEFKRHGIVLRFHRMDEIVYQQFGDGFEPSLSIIDVLMFNGVQGTREYLACCKLLDAAELQAGITQ